MKQPSAAESADHTDWALLIPQSGPDILYVTVATISVNRIAPEISYAIRLIAVPLLVFGAWR